MTSSATSFWEAGSGRNLSLRCTKRSMEEGIPTSMDIHGLLVEGCSLYWFSNGTASGINTDCTTKAFNKYNVEKKKRDSNRSFFCKQLGNSEQTWDKFMCIGPIWRWKEIMIIKTPTHPFIGHYMSVEKPTHNQLDTLRIQCCTAIAFFRSKQSH